MNRVKLAGLFFFAIVGAAYAVTVNPTSNVLGDSANTATTLVYRDSNGDFAMRNLTATQVAADIIPADTNTARLHTPTAVSISSTAFLTIVVPKGDSYWVETCDGALWANCVSSGGATGANLVFSTKTATACRSSI